ncbi:alpha beta-hydrolase protein [Rutstroemia sp. NJR-2017a BVV2]|nr:alpha beta-hydrolase protein [Rutstroemia sp. NJR-2017a BVV2]
MARSQSIFNGTDLSSKMRGLLGFMSLAQFPFSQSLSFASTTPKNSSILSTDGFSSPSLSYSAAQKAVCVTGYLDVPVQATTTEILYDGPTNNTQLTSLLISLFALDSTVVGSLIGGTASVSDTYTIYSKLCVPTDATVESIKTVQFLTHGGTTDHTYWDFATDYSYVDAAAARGYATFSYDRLGTGRSQHPDPIQVVQVATQVELAHALISGLKAGSYGGVTFGSAVGVGHSLGSALTQGISAKYPSDFTALALTGHSGFQGGVPVGIASQASQIANTVDLPQFSGLANGYITESSTPQAIQFAFFHHPGYDETILEKQLATRQTNALGETFTLGAAYAPAAGFTGPVIILNGNEDWFFCQGNCNAQEITSTFLPYFFPNASPKSTTYTVGNTGHNVNLHYSASKSFGILLEFLADTA